MARSVGLDFHARGVRAVEVVGSSKNYRVVRYAQRDLTPRGGAPDATELREALGELFKELKFDRSTVITDMNTNETVVREIPVPFKADDQIRKVIKYEAEHHLHDCDADDVIVQYTRVADKEEGTDLLVFAARKDDVGRRIDAARGAGIEPLAMDLDALALYNAVRASGELDESPTCVLLDIGSTSTEMIFVQDGRVRALRSIRLGVDTVTDALARDMDIEASEAGAKVEGLAGTEAPGDLLVSIGEPLEEKRETEKSHAELEQGLIRQRRDELVGRLKREFVRTGAALHGGTPARILVVGPGLGVPALLEHLQGRLGIPVQPFVPTDHFAARLKEGEAGLLDAEGAVALGLALKGLGLDPLRVDFRQEELRVAHKFDLLKVPLAVTVSLLFVALFAASVFSYHKRESLQKELFDPIATEAYTAFHEIVEASTSAYNKVCTQMRGGQRNRVDPQEVEQRGPLPQVLVRYRRELERMRRKLSDHFGDVGGRVPPIVSAVRIWNEIFGVIREHHQELVYFDLENLTIRQETVRMTIIVESAQAADKLEGYLKGLGIFREWKPKPWSSQPVKGTPYQRTTLTFEKPKRRRR
ncbi:MAG: pilus assembly protein PilM [Planctomycetota bacterium]